MSTYHIAAKQDGRSGNGGHFYDAKIYRVPVGLGENFIISSEANGLGSFAVDDKLRVTIVDYKNSTKTAWWEHDFSLGGSGVITPLLPTNLKDVEAGPHDQLSKNFHEMLQWFEGKEVNVSFELSDIGGFESGDNLYLTLRS